MMMKMTLSHAFMVSITALVAIVDGQHHPNTPYDHGSDLQTTSKPFIFIHPVPTAASESRFIQTRTVFIDPIRPTETVFIDPIRTFETVFIDPIRTVESSTSIVTSFVKPTFTLGHSILDPKPTTTRGRGSEDDVPNLPHHGDGSY
ncbi:hypothetical protein HYFRA_00014110 [Hymenoscyphus fraxineus]|uniref:Uncharacterized protein n=1 Tax=Hymenoscyphus fraxineus TaxID=746836 RepID=A0A9N9Q1Q5_9HELO|nr:hypothetical protein HYFRA_00014110 [Hymenoscyphus fraxineus]